MSTTLLIGLCPDAISLAWSHAGESPIWTPVKTRAVNLRQSAGSSTETETTSEHSSP
jgi:hypothetical protein